MIKRIIISHLNNIAAIVHENKIQELVVINDPYQINDIYIGTVQTIFTSINAAFVKLNHHGKNGFIHVSDTTKCKKPHNLRKIAEAITIKQILLVQIIKEPTKSKGPRLTTNIHLSGKYLILMPFNNTICIANSIYDENERAYLRALGILIKPALMGLLFKDSASGIKEEELIEDLRSLKSQWYFIQKAAMCQSSPALLYTNQDIIKKIMTDTYNNQVTSIIVDSKNIFKKLNYLFAQHVYPALPRSTKIQLYQQKQCILERFNISHTMSAALKSKVDLAPGAYLFIESLEALTVIDVNSGSFNPSKNSQEAILRTNCLAANEIAYQLRVRNINGVIIIDFIDMKSYKDQLHLLEYFNTVLRIDSARPQIIQLSELGLVELTRRRKGQSLSELIGQRVVNFSIAPDEISLANSYIQKVSLNVKTIFFKRNFSYYLRVKTGIAYVQENKDCTIRLFPLVSSSIVPFCLYYFLAGKTN
uniref:Ribonuclease E n=1 Tax=Balbiania investiens TaxID=111861 RepID=A0A4D6BLA7_9FLOR|nr:ribonuclease E [Balbiania investiens]QBX88535.1 ribonuclease E [Balbiania investiens]